MLPVLLANMGLPVVYTLSNLVNIRGGSDVDFDELVIYKLI